VIPRYPASASVGEADSRTRFSCGTRMNGRPPWWRTSNLPAPT